MTDALSNTAVPKTPGYPPCQRPLIGWMRDRLLVLHGWYDACKERGHFDAIEHDVSLLTKARSLIDHDMMWSAKRLMPDRLVATYGEYEHLHDLLAVLKLRALDIAHDRSLVKSTLMDLHGFYSALYDVWPEVEKGRELPVEG